MSQTLTCANGHRWAVADGHGTSTCAECGAAVIESVATASEEDSIHRTLAAMDELPPPPLAAEGGRIAPLGTPPPVTPESGKLATSRELATGRANVLHPAPGPSLETLGRYCIVRQIGRGGMGSVYLAYDTQLDRQVAIKVARFAGESPHALERFIREGRAAATLDHPNICPVYDVGEIDGIHYLAMAYIEGRPLSELIRNCL